MYGELLIKVLFLGKLQRHISAESTRDCETNIIEIVFTVFFKAIIDDTEFANFLLENVCVKQSKDEI